MSGQSHALCICGGGNGAHVMAGLAAAHAQALEVRVLTLYQNEAAIWTEKLAEGDFIVAKKHPDGSIEEIRAKPALVTNDASQAVTGADVIIFCVPAFAHQQYFEAIARHVTPGSAIIGLPGQPGFEFQCMHVWREKATGCVILNYETLPWACRISEFGRKVDLLGTKDALLGSRVCVGGDRPLPGADSAQLLLQTLLGTPPALSQAHSYLEIILMTKAFAHPPLMYGRWGDWDGTPLREKPLFYQGLSKEAASILGMVSEEIVQTARAISQARPEVTLDHVEHLEPWFIGNYSKTVEDPSCLYTAMRTNSAYNNLVHPMSEISPGQYVPDFQHRYLSEDVPFGLAVVKGVAQIAGVATPYTDKVMTWAQGHLGKEFIVGSELKGKDVKDTRAPQAFGLNTLDDLLAMV
ncbi:hypothetical protein ACOMHN_052502 [Nucella lapillus]